MKLPLAALFALPLALAACSNPSSTAPMQPRTAISGSPPGAPSVQEGTPPPGAAAKCEGVTSQQGGGSAYLGCLNRQEMKRQ